MTVAMSVLRRARAVPPRRAGAAALAASALLLFWRLVREPGPFGMVDLAVYRAGGQALVDGTPLYSAHPEGSLLPFTYPPFAGLLCMPLAAVGWTGARLLMTAASLAGLALLARAAIASGGARRPAPAGALPAVLAVALLLEPVRATVSFGQVNLLIAALVLVDLTVRAHRPSSGVLIGLAAAIKLTPLVFVPYLFLTGRRRAGLTALGTFGATVAVGWLLLPAASVAYWSGMFASPERVGGVPYSGNQSLLGGLARVLGGVADARPVWLLAAALVGTLGLLVAARVAATGRELGGAVLCGLTGLLVSPISWTHHWVWVVPAAVAGAYLVADRPARRRVVPGAALAGGMLLFVAAPVWWPPRGGDREYTHSGLDLLTGNAYLLAGLAVLVTVGCGLLGRPRSAGGVGGPAQSKSNTSGKARTTNQAQAAYTTR